LNRRPADYESAALPTELLRPALQIVSSPSVSVKDAEGKSSFSLSISVFARARGLRHGVPGLRADILLPMHTDRSNELQRLADHYHSMYDGELLALAEDADGLTDVARQALASEMQSRGLQLPDSEERPSGGQRPKSVPVHDAAFDAGAFAGMEAVPLSSGASSSFAQIAGEDAAGTSAEVDFTWKTVLCECETVDQARALQLALGKAGIESWLEARREYPRVLVAADELDKALAIANQPIPQEIVDELTQGVPEFDLPTCPACHAPDPVLEDVEPTNQWLCESCGHHWSDPADGSEVAEG
jgi:hypothetical protein